VFPLFNTPKVDTLLSALGSQINVMSEGTLPDGKC
jgi:hypothetical protein